VSLARQMLSRNLIHCWPRPAAPYRRRGTPSSVALAETSLPPESVVVFGLARARWPRARADRAARGRLVAPSSHFPLILLEDDKDRSAPWIALRSPCSASSVRRSISIIVSCAAQGSVIQAGNSARVLSGCSITKWMLPPWCNRRTTTTRSPARGCSGYWIRTSKGCSWAVCRRLERHDERAGAVALSPALTRGAEAESARRGALFLGVAAGYLRIGRDRIEMDPDQPVQDALRLVFTKFTELQSVRQVHVWLRDEGIALPVACHTAAEGRSIVWKLPLYNTVHNILTNPVYAGAYAFGRTMSKV